MKTRSRQGEQGFTLIELLTIIGIVGVLSALSLNSFTLYRSSAAYAAVQESLNQARVALEASYSEPDATFPDVSYDQMVQGKLFDANAQALLPQFQVSPKTKISIEHDSTCDNATCISDQITIRHRQGKKYAFFTRYGDGLDIFVGDVPGEGF